MKTPSQRAVSLIPTKDLIKELARREAKGKVNKLEQELAQIAAKVKARKLVLGCEYYEEEYNNWYANGVKGMPKKVFNYVLGVVKKGKFKDFYYNSGIKDYGEFVPSCFAESMESTYEFRGDFAIGLDYLKRAGYSYFRDITEEMK